VISISNRELKGSETLASASRHHHCAGISNRELKEIDFMLDLVNSRQILAHLK